jgi:TrpR family transcriptional regulator, trp operon repressor
MKQKIDNLVLAMNAFDAPAELDAFLDEIFTRPERRDFALRWRLMEMLHAGISQRAIAARLGVSLCKITRGSKIVKNRASVTRHILDTMNKDHSHQPTT